MNELFFIGLIIFLSVVFSFIWCSGRKEEVMFEADISKNYTQEEILNILRTKSMTVPNMSYMLNQLFHNFEERIKKLEKKE